MNQKEKISCREAIEQLWAYIDGELPDNDAQSVESHLDACRGCYPNYNFQKAFCQFMRNHAERPVPANLRRRVFMALLEEDRKIRGDEGGDAPPGGAAQ
jgi:anti-sigma factor (TIGR02949 family)